MRMIQGDGTVGSGEKGAGEWKEEKKHGKDWRDKWPRCVGVGVSSFCSTEQGVHPVPRPPPHLSSPCCFSKISVLLAGENSVLGEQFPGPSFNSVLTLFLFCLP